MCLKLLRVLVCKVDVAQLPQSALAYLQLASQAQYAS